MKKQLFKQGGSSAIIIPSEMLNKYTLNASVGDTLEVDYDKKKDYIIIRKVK